MFKSVALALLAASAVAISEQIGAPTPAVDCADCDNGYCYQVLSTEDGNSAANTCAEAGGYLAKLWNATGSFAFVASVVLPKRLPAFGKSAAFIDAWDGNDYGATCLEMYPSQSGSAGAAIGNEASCAQPFPAVCQFTLEDKFAICANCTDQCFAPNQKCFRFKMADYTEAEAVAACESDGGKLWNAWGSVEFYFVNELLGGKSSRAWAEGYDKNPYVDNCIAFHQGNNPAAGQGGAMTNWDCNGRLPAICEYPMTTKSQTCQDDVAEISPEDLNSIQSLALKYAPQLPILGSSGAAAVAASAVASVLSVFIASFFI